MSSVVGYLASSSSSPEGHDDGNNERLDFVRPTTATPDLSLSGETFLHAAVSLKDQVRRRMTVPASYFAICHI